MKFFTLFALLGLITASAIDAWSHSTPTSHAERQDLTYLEGRYYAPENELTARHLNFEELSQREYAELEERNPLLAVRVAVQAIKLIVKAVKEGIKRDRNVRL